VYSGHFIEIRNIGIRVVFELFIYFRPIFHLRMHMKPFGGRALRRPDPILGVGP